MNARTLTLGTAMLLGASAAAQADPALNGRWVVGPFGSPQLATTITLDFRAGDELVVGGVCEGPKLGKIAVATTMRFKIEGGKLVLPSGERRQEGDFGNCAVTIAGGAYPYAVEGGTLKITADGSTVEFRRL